MNGAYPSDLEAEDLVLGACLSEPKNVPSIAAILGPEAFAPTARNGHVFAAILDLWGRSEPVNHMTVARALGGEGLEEVGGQSALLRMIQAHIPGMDAAFWAEKVAEMARRRAMMDAGNRFVEDALDPRVGPDDALARAHERLLGLQTRREKSPSATWAEVVAGDGFDITSLWTDVEAFMEDPEFADKQTGILTGWSLLDQVGGLPVTGLLTVLGDTGAGKSFFIQWLAWELWKLGVSVHLITTEMSRREVARRLIFMAAGVDPDAVRYNRGATNEQRASVRQAIHGIPGGPRLVITDVGRIPLAALVTEVQRQHRTHGTQVFIVDHIQHVLVPGLRPGEIAARTKEVVESLKGLAMNENMAGVQVSHINREASKGPLGKHSGIGGASIEQDSSQMLTLTPVHFVVNEWVPFGSEQEIKAFKLAHGYLHVQFDIAKNRSGSEPWDIRTLDFRQGGRWVVPEVGMQWT